MQQNLLRKVTDMGGGFEINGNALSCVLIFLNSSDVSSVILFLLLYYIISVY